jgi:hypothetical protein
MTHFRHAAIVTALLASVGALRSDHRHHARARAIADGCNY